MSDLVGNPEDRFSHNEAHFMEAAVLRLRYEVEEYKKKNQRHISTRAVA